MKKFDTRGETRHKKKLSKQGLLLDYIWRAFGGNNAVARLLGVHKQTPINWRDRGGVPLRMVWRVAAKLKVSPEALNFKAVSSCHPLSYYSWEDVEECAKALLKRNLSK
jgi:hypothetical protein